MALAAAPLDEVDAHGAVFRPVDDRLVGDFVYSRAFQMMVELQNLRVLEILADATNVIAEGEVMQLASCHDPDISEQRYLDTIRFKTAKLFEAADLLSAINLERAFNTFNRSTERIETLNLIKNAMAFGFSARLVTGV